MPSIVGFTHVFMVIFPSYVQVPEGKPIGTFGRPNPETVPGQESEVLQIYCHPPIGFQVVAIRAIGIYAI